MLFLGSHHERECGQNQIQDRFFLAYNGANEMEPTVIYKQYSSHRPQLDHTNQLILVRAAFYFTHVKNYHTMLVNQIWWNCPFWLFPTVAIRTLF